MEHRKTTMSQKCGLRFCFDNFGNSEPIFIINLLLNSERIRGRSWN